LSESVSPHYRETESCKGTSGAVFNSDPLPRAAHAVLSIREVARRVGRDVKAVHGDVTALVAAGAEKRDGRKVVFP
jgi:hypothetical protein